MGKDKREESNHKRRYNPDSGIGVRGIADWASADASLLKRLVAATSGMGGAVRFGYTRDGGAYSIGIYGDGDPFTVYQPPGDGLDDWIKGMVEAYEA